MNQCLIRGPNSSLYFFFKCLKILAFNLIFNTVSISAYCICSICHHVLFKGNYYKMRHAQALQITEEVALWADSSPNCVSLMIPSHCHLQSICVPIITIVTERSFRQKGETVLRFSFTGEPTNQDTVHEESRGPVHGLSTADTHKSNIAQVDAGEFSLYGN